MNGVIGLVDLLSDTELSTDQSELVSSIKRCGESLLSLLSDILDFSKIDAGKLQLQKAPTDARSIFREVHQVLSVHMGDKDVVLTSNTAGLPDHMPVLVDKERLKQILLNLGGNAVKFTEQGAVDVTYTILGETPVAYTLQASVTDTGIGIDEAQKPKLFKMFSQLDNSTTKRFQGTGLGLVICQKLVEAMGGCLDYNSSVGKGSHFWITLDIPKHTGSSLEEADSSGLASRPMTGILLIVDDNNLNCQIAKKMAQKHGLLVDTACDGLEAVSAVLKKAYSLIFMDVQMPVMDGLTATKVIRDRKITTPIVAFTASAYLADVEKCLEAGMSDHLPKPINKASFSAMVRKWLPEA